MGSLLGGAAPLLCGSGALPLHIAAAQRGAPLKLAAATCGGLLRTVGGNAASAPDGRQHSGVGALAWWQPSRWRSAWSRVGTAGQIPQRRTFTLCVASWFAMEVLIP